MNFLQETRLFSALSLTLLELMLIVTFVFTLHVDDERGYYYAHGLYERHLALWNGVRDSGGIATLPLGTGNPTLLGGGIIAADGSQEFYPPSARLWWSILPREAWNRESAMGVRPVKASDIYLQPVFSSSGGRTCVSFFDGSPRHAAELKLQVLSAMVLSFALALPLLTWLFLKRASRLYFRVLEEARRSPVAGEVADDPAALIGALHQTNAELERLFLEATTRADDLSALSGTLSRNIPSGLLVLDRRDAILECNSRAGDILGIRPSEGESLEALAPSWGQFLALVRRAIEDREPRSRVEIRENGKDLGITIAPLFTRERHHIGTLVLFSDLTSWKRIEGELRIQGNLAALGTFASGIAHEFRNSLATLLGYMNLLQKEPDTAKGSSYLEAMLREARHMNEVVTRFLDYVRLNAIHPEPVRLSEILEEALNGLQSSHPAVHFVPEGSDVTLKADAHLLARAVRAVAENACQAQAGGDVILRWRTDGDALRLEIRDRGPGIAPEHKDQIFLPFFTTKPEGTGLGLALAHKIATLHGGTLEWSVNPEGGTVFTFLLKK